MSGRRTIEGGDLFRFRFAQDPWISPDGSKVLFILRRMDLATNKYFSNLAVIDVSSREIEPLTFGDQRDTHARWSPDGKAVAFISNRKLDGEERGRNRLWLLSEGLREARLLARQDGDVSELSWSPDGKKLAFIFKETDPEEEEEKKKDPADQRATTVKRLHYREDGLGYIGSKRAKLWTVDLESGRTKQVSGGDYDDSEPCWSPEGDRIAFLSNRIEFADYYSGNTDVYIVPE